MATNVRRPRYKLFSDAIHGTIELHPLSARIIDTVEFQRLRRLKQLGGAYSVFPAAGHNRFEHCLGVAWLSQRFVRHLQDKQPDLGITEVEVVCVEVAGLVHDLGHGVMSHAFDSRFIPHVRGGDEKWKKWTHEWASVAMLDALFANNSSVAEEARSWGLGPDDVHFIKQLVLGGCKELPPGFVWQQAPAGKHFLYEIVSNKRSGVDVDKWDYFERDSRQLGVPIGFVSSRLLLLARVVIDLRPDGEGRTSIAFPLKVRWCWACFRNESIHSLPTPFRKRGASTKCLSRAFTCTRPRTSTASRASWRLWRWTL